MAWWLVALAAVPCLVLGGAAASAGLGDAALLLQEGLRANQHKAELEKSRLFGTAHSSVIAGRMQALARAFSAPKGASFPAFYCGAYPNMCKPPFNCQNFNLLSLATLPFTGIAPTGEAALSIWCIAPYYSPYLEKCIQKPNLTEAAQIQYNFTLLNMGVTDMFDASYCFQTGQCEDAEVNENTTLQQSYKLCDKRYGRKGWSRLGQLGTSHMEPFFLHLAQQFPPWRPIWDIGKGFARPNKSADWELAEYFLASACAMGNFHCDQVYCKETYCKDPYYIKQFGHMQPSQRKEGHWHNVGK